MDTYTQLFPPAPIFTEKNIIDLSGKVYIVASATSGISFELAKILYTLHATVYVGFPSSSAFSTAYQKILASAETSQGTLRPFIADLADLRTIKPAVEAFLKENYRLDVLFLHPRDTTDSHDVDISMRVNCLASFILVTLLYPLMHRTNTHFCHINTSIRIVYVSSLLIRSTPKGGVHLVPGKEEGNWKPKQLSGVEGYMQSKAGLYLLAHEFASKQEGMPRVDEHGLTSRNSAGVVHVCVNPGLVKGDMQRYALAPVRGMVSVMGKSSRYGAYTELFAGIAPDVENGDFIIPWGRKGSVPEHLYASSVAKEGDLSVGERFFGWCEEQVKPFL